MADDCPSPILVALANFLFFCFCCVLCVVSFLVFVVTNACVIKIVISIAFLHDST
jgi:hypothetical protein